MNSTSLPQCNSLELLANLAADLKYDNCFNTGLAGNQAISSARSVIIHLAGTQMLMAPDIKSWRMH